MEAKKSKKKLIIILVIVAVLAAAIVIFGVPYFKRHFIEVKMNEAEAINTPAVDLGTKNILTVYFTRNGNCDFEDNVDAVSSASLMRDGDKLIGNCELAAEMIQHSVGGDIYAIRTKKKYPSSYTGTVGAASEEFSEGTQLELEGELPDISKYDTVFILYPLWWYKVPMAVQSFVQQVDLSGKRVYALVSHGGSGEAGSVAALEETAGIKIERPFFTLFDDDAAGAKDSIGEWLNAIK